MPLESVDIFTTKDNKACRQKKRFIIVEIPQIIQTLSTSRGWRTLLKFNCLKNHQKDFQFSHSGLSLKQRKSFSLIRLTDVFVEKAVEATKHIFTSETKYQAPLELMSDFLHSFLLFKTSFEEREWQFSIYFRGFFAASKTKQPEHLIPNKKKLCLLTIAFNLLRLPF